MKKFTDTTRRQGRPIRVLLTTVAVLLMCAAPAGAAAFSESLSSGNGTLSGAASALVWASFAIAAISLQGVRAARSASHERRRQEAEDLRLLHGPTKAADTRDTPPAPRL